jgi:hypothetical protein
MRVFLLKLQACVKCDYSALHKVTKETVLPDIHPAEVARPVGVQRQSQ